ncbi:hypothetical protein KKH23_07340 [Patescibacteria group bacterium]|uniref:Uncharacterized protein n=1 Tax=viral metagenome TaxID=1070528 RepID=A0A6M3X7G4_9ZZZZ|nr:hypothetical protein [Patescibacteria group bacterium]
MKFVKTLDHISWTPRGMKKRKSFDLFKDEYASWILDEYGVTHLSFEGNNTYCVVVDMHS